MCCSSCKCSRQSRSQSPLRSFGRRHSWQCIGCSPCRWHRVTSRWRRCQRCSSCRCSHQSRNQSPANSFGRGHPWRCKQYSLCSPDRWWHWVQTTIGRGMFGRLCRRSTDRRCSFVRLRVGCRQAGGGLSTRRKLS